MTTKRGRSTYRPTSRPERLRERIGSQRRVLVLVGLALFLIADVILVGLAFAADDRSTDDMTQRPIPTFGTPQPAPSQTPTPSAEPVADVAASRFLVAGSADVLWRATEGSCDAPAVVERSLDGGASWSVLATGAAMDLRVVHALTASDADGVQLIGATGADCAIGGFSSSDAGDTWASDPAVLTTVPSEAAAASDGTRAVVVDGQPVAAPCPAVEVLAGGAGRTVAACPAVLAEWDGAAGSWSVVPFAGIHALEVQSERILFAARGVPGCAGLGVLRMVGAALSGASGPETVGCAAEADRSAPAALTSIDGSVWLWVGDSVFTSTDDGATWVA